VAALRRLALAAALLAATPAAADPSSADPVQRWHGEIAEASARFGIPVSWIERVIHAESGGRTSLAGRPIVSPAGAMGLMQLMPATWTAMRAAHGLGADPHDPRDNILAGTAYLRAMFDRFGYPGLFAAYNAGPGRYAGYLASGRALPAETRAYLAEVSGVPLLRSPSPARRTPPPLFVALGTGDASAGPGSSGVPQEPRDPLFALRLSR